MAAATPTPATSLLGLALTFDPASPDLVDTLATLRARPGFVLAEPQMPFAALTVETNDTRRDHAWLESLAAVVAVDVAFVEVLTEEALAGHDDRRSRRRTRDPFDDSPMPAEPASAPRARDFQP